MKKQTFKYRRCKEVSKGFTTTSRSVSTREIGFHRHSEINEIVDKMINQYQDEMEKLGFDISTAKFEISLLTTLNSQT